MLVSIDAKTRKLWIFCTASKKAPIHILWWLLSNIRCEHNALSRIRVDKDGALIGSCTFCRFISDNEALNLKSTGKYASYLNCKIERSNRTIAECVRCYILNTNCPEVDWCYTAEHAADVYGVTLHSDLDMSPQEAWYNNKALYCDMHIWGCQVLVPAQNMKKSEDRAEYGLFYGYTRRRALLKQFDDSTKNVKHAHGARLLEIDSLMPITPPGQRLLQLESAYKEGDIELPLVTIIVGDCAHFEMEPFCVQLPLPPVGISINIQLAFDETHHLPYVVQVDEDTAFGRTFPPHFRRNVYILAIGDQYPVMLDDTLADFNSKQSANTITPIDLWLVKRNINVRTDLEEQQIMFDQVRFVPVTLPVISESVACRAVASLYKPYCPEHIEKNDEEPFQVRIQRRSFREL
jgi:hypothetical protein